MAKKSQVQALIKQKAGSLPAEFTKRGYVMRLGERAIHKLIASRLGYQVETDDQIRGSMTSRWGAVPDFVIIKKERRVGVELIMGSRGLERRDMLIRLYHLASTLRYGGIQACAGIIFIIFGEIGKRAQQTLEDIAREMGSRFQLIRIDKIPAKISEEGALIIEEKKLSDVLLPKLAEALTTIGL
jgi:hypothetical protein